MAVRTRHIDVVPIPAPPAGGNAPSAEALLALAGLPRLLERSRGAPAVRIGVIDGPVDAAHPALATADVRMLRAAACPVGDAACAHGTFVAGMLAAPRGSGTPAIAPGCPLIVRPIFGGAPPAAVPVASPETLAAALADCVDAGVRVVNLSAAVHGGAAHEDRALGEALAYAAQQDVVILAAAGNRRTVAGSMLTRHPAVIPVSAYSAAGRPLPAPGAATSIGRRGVGAPGDGVPSLAPGGGHVRAGGTSAATPFVTGAAALLLSLHPAASAAAVGFALRRAVRGPRRGVVAPLMDAAAADALLTSLRR